MRYVQLSSTIAGRYKILQTYVYPAFFISAWLIIVYYTFETNDPAYLIYTTGWMLVLTYFLYTRGKKMYPLGYDAENLYLQQKG